MLESLALCLHLTRRNWAVYKKDLIANISPTVADPAFSMLALGIGLGAFVAQVEDRSYAQYLAPGLTVTTALFTAFFETSYGFFVRMTFENVFKAMLTTPIGVREIILGEYIWVSIKGAVMCFGCSVILALFGMMTNWYLLPLMLLVGILVGLPCGAMGLLATSYARNINQFQTVYSFLISPLYFFSGIFFPLDQMPQALQLISKLFPLYHGVRMAQSIFWDESIGEAFLINGSILLLQGLVLSCWAYSRISKKLVS